jgi:hypothetical protein
LLLADTSLSVQAGYKLVMLPSMGSKLGIRKLGMLETWRTDHGIGELFNSDRLIYFAEAKISQEFPN